MKSWFIKNKVIILYIFVAVLFQSGFLRLGNPFRYDWSWPFFNMGDCWHNLFLFGTSGLMTVFSKNACLIFGLFQFIPVSTLILLPILMCLFSFLAAYGFYLFIIKKIKTEFIAIVVGVVYAFTPYIFIRTVTGFMWSILAYSVLPLFLLHFYKKKTKWSSVLSGFLLTLIFAQIQAGLLVSLVLLVGLIISLFFRNFKTYLKNYFFTYLFFFIFNLSWLILYFATKQSGASDVLSGTTVTTLNFIASLPHSFMNIFMLSDHHITYYFFYPLAHDKWFLAGWLIVWFVVFCAIFNKKNREIVLTFMASCVLVLPFVKGPTGIFSNLYLWFYNHVPQIAVFRETYHFEFVYAVSLCVLFAFGLDWLWSKIDTIKIMQITKTGLKTLLAGSAIFIIAPYLTFNYGGYLKPQEISQEYNQLYNFLQTNKDYCKKIYYPPGLGFVYFKNDKTSGASNSDILAQSLGVSYLDDGTSVLNLPSEEMFYRNELVSQFYEKDDLGEFTNLLNAGNIDCVILRLDTETKYDQSSNLWREKDPTVRKKWNQTDLRVLTESKKGLQLEKQFGEDILIYKINPEYQAASSMYKANIEQKTGKGISDQFPTNYQLPTTNYLPLTDWANNYAYYKDGWSRGRYDFWRKHLFTQLRQDFIYTDKKDSIVSGKIAQTGSCDLWARYLTGGKAGGWQLVVGNNTFQISKDLGEEEFIWKKVGDVELKGETDVEIKNVLGENAIADLVLLKK